MIGIIQHHLAVIVSEPPVLLRLGPFAVRWYALAYIGGALGAFWVMRRMLRRPAAPMPPEALDSFIIWAMAGVILGGRIGYILFYGLGDYLAHPLSVFAIWQGGMSFHGGAAGLLLATLLFCRRHGYAWLRVCDYVVVVQPIGQGLGRLANFVNGELWGAPTTLPWGVIFEPGGPPRHPSQLYEAVLEGILLFALLSWLFWRTTARLRPGMLMGVFCLGFGVARMIVELVREPDAQLRGLTGPLHMGQWLSLPMIALGLWLVWRAKRRPPLSEGVVELSQGAPLSGEEARA
jgi:phosphatidylglycerol:prolipoprotein diacylglycerol transferase